MKKDIYIIKNKINNKVYIGQAKNAAERWMSHLANAKYENKSNRYSQVIHRAMIKYGIEHFYYEILEYQISNYDEREQYWINHYNSTVPNGYNVAIGGKGNGSGLNSPLTVFENDEQLLSCISEISSSNKTFINIARKYGCCAEVISAINNGTLYRMDDRFVYPLRNTDTRYSPEKLKQIRYSLKYETDLTLFDIAQKYNIDASQVSAINNGHIYYVKTDTYPLRNKRKQDLSKDTMLNIINDIMYSDLCLSDIAKKYNVSRNIITGINKGYNYKQPNMIYPLRMDKDERSKSFKKFLDVDEIKDIIGLLQTSLSIEQIAQMYNVTSATIRNINNGQCKKYKIEGITYPIRKLKKHN